MGLSEKFIYLPLHVLVQDWINSSIGSEADSLINRLAGTYLIGNGAAGTAADLNGGNGGWLLGDGGAGYDSTAAGVGGGGGGSGGLLGNG